MSESYTKNQYIQREDNLEYEEDYIEEELLYTDENEKNINQPLTRTPSKFKSPSPKFNDYKYTSSYHVKQAEKALKTLKSIVKKPGWEKIIKHKSGVVVYSKSGINQHDKTPVFMGEHIISGVSPQSVFAVIGMRKLWDEWYEEGSLVENLNDTTSSTYMVMQAFGYKSRDLSLVEKIECAPNGSIFFASTSIDNQKVPQMDGKIRAEVKLNGWILEPVPFSPPKTKITYVLQVQINGWIPSLFVKKYLVKRPLVLSAIENYLKKNGPPPMIISTTPPPSRRISGRISNASNDDGNVNADVKNSRKKRIANDRREISPPRDQKTSLTRDSSALSSTSLLSLKAALSSSQSSPVLPSEVVLDEHPALRHTLSPKHSVSSLSLKQRSPRKILHRHTVAAQRAMITIKTLVSNYDGWNLHADNQGVKIFTRDVPNKLTPQMRGEIIISGGFTPEDILAVILNVDMRKLWDDRFEEGKVVERLGQDDTLSRVSMKGTFPISGRDLAMISKVEKDPETDIIWLAGTSISDPLIPESKKHVRAELSISGWRLRPVIDESGQSNSVEVTYIVDIDLKLESIPPSILKSISMQTPMCVAKIDELIKKTGHPPYIKTSPGIVISEGLNTKTYQCNLTVGSIGGGSVTEIKLSKIMYPSGFNTSITPESSNIELSPSGDVVRVMLPIGIEIKTLNIKITRNHSDNDYYTFNGENIHMAYSKEAEEPEPEPEPMVHVEDPVKLEEEKEIVEPLSSPEISMHPTHDDNINTSSTDTTLDDNNKTSSTNTTLIARNGFDINLLDEVNAGGNDYVDENVLKEYDQLKHDLLGHAPRTIVTPSTFKPIEESQNVITPNETPEEENSKATQDIQKIDYTIPTPDQFSKKYVPAPFFTANTTKYIPEPIFLKSSETYTSDVVTSSSSTTEQTDDISLPTYTPIFSYPEKSTPQQWASRRISSQQRSSQIISSQQRSSRRVSSRLLPEHMMNQTQFHESNVNADSSRSNRISFFTTGNGSNKRIGVMVGKEEVSFSPQEAGLMLVFMILAYYAGKFSECE